MPCYVKVIIPLVKVTPGKGTTVLHVFSGPPDGEYPYGGVLYSKADGRIFGTTNYGGTQNQRETPGGGTLYELDPDGTYTVLHSFGGAGDGIYPVDAPVRDSAGNLYGTTGPNTTTGTGTIWKYSSAGVYSVVHNFKVGAPGGRLIWGKGGDTLFGTNPSAGNHDAGSVFFYNPGTGGYGVSAVFEVGGANGTAPFGSLVVDKQGYLYGITQGGGAYASGVVFRVNPYKKGRNITVIHDFDPHDNTGYYPYAGLILIDDKLYGTTSEGGNTSGCGVVFATGLKRDAFYDVVHAFAGPPDGCGPFAGLAAGPKRYLYGDTYAGGEFNYGTVFRIRP